MFFRKKNSATAQPICEFTGEPEIRIQTRSGSPIDVGRVSGAYRHNGFVIFTSPKGGACVTESEFVSFEVVRRA